MDMNNDINKIKKDSMKIVPSLVKEQDEYLYEIVL